MKILNKRELQQGAHQTLTLKISLRSTKRYTVKPYSFLVNDARLTSDNTLRFRKNLFNI